MVRISRARFGGAVTAVLTLVVGAGTVAVLATGAAPASAAGKVPTLLATPHTKLTDGQVIKVHGSHLNPGDEIILLECQRTADLAVDCDPLTSTPVTVSATGQVPATNFTVNTGLVGTGTCGTSAADAKNCEIAADDLSDIGGITGGLNTFVAFVDLSFKASGSTGSTTTTTSTTLPLGL